MEIIEINNIKVRQSMPHTQDQNSIPKYSRGVMTAMAHIMIINVRLPKNLWLKAYKYSIYLLN
jgi:hypothetical protein